MSRSLSRLIGQRLLQFIPVMVLATFIVFGLASLVPGDLATMLAGESPTPEHIAEIRHLYGLDRPFLAQYGLWLWHALQGNLGQSMQSGEFVTQLILQRLPNTMLIALGALLIGVVVGIPLGVAAAIRSGRWEDRLVTSIASLGVAVPSFWLGMILVTIFALELQWFPASGAASLAQDPLQALRHAVLPCFALAGATVAEVSRQLRSSLIEVLSSQYVRTLRAKGLRPGSVLFKHAMRNVSVMLITVIGLMVNRLFAATVVIEAVFAIPGTGSLIAGAAINKDFPVVQGVVLVLVVLVVCINLTVDVLAALLDPRVRRA